MAVSTSEIVNRGMSVIKKYVNALIPMLLAWVTTLPSIATTAETLMPASKMIFRLVSTEKGSMTSSSSKDGLVYDAQALLSDVRAIVKADKEALGMGPKIPMKVEH